MVVDIIDVGFGNIQSIQNWLTRNDIPSKIVTKAKELQSETILLPGVGSAGRYMDALKKKDFKIPLVDLTETKRIIGICLGFQLLLSGTEEDGGVEGLDILKGYVKKMGNNLNNNGWIKVPLDYKEITKFGFQRKISKNNKTLFCDRLYFNHEYGVILKDQNIYTKSVSDELKKFSSIAAKNNILGMQFHPEKSQAGGNNLLKLLV